MFTEQDDFTHIIQKYDLLNENEVFDDNLPDEIDQEERYNQMLDDCPPANFEVPNHWSKSKYSEALKENDETLYRCGFADYADTLAEDYFEMNDNFYEPEEMREAINAALDDRIQIIEEDKL